MDPNVDGRLTNKYCFVILCGCVWRWMMPSARLEFCLFNFMTFNGMAEVEVEAILNEA